MCIKFLRHHSNINNNIAEMGEDNKEQAAEEKTWIEKKNSSSAIQSVSSCFIAIAIKDYCIES